MAFSSRENLLEALQALGDWLDSQSSEPAPIRFEFFLCGGACFLFHELPRFLGVTNNIDVWCQFEDDEVLPLTGWSFLFEKGIETVRKQFADPLPQDWFSCEASFKLAVHFGLPTGAKKRATVVDFGSKLRTFFSSRQDLIAFKFLALVAAKHPETTKKSKGDLLALIPTEAEIAAARNWLVNVPGANQLWKDDCEREIANWDA